MHQKNKWIVAATHEQMSCDPTVVEISKKLGIKMPTAQLLCNRGCTSADTAKSFLMKADEQLHDPFEMKDMEKAARRIIEAVENKEKIVIFGDYDVDGVTSVSSLLLYLRSIGADVTYYIPCRATEGYGMSESAIRLLAEDGCKLIITVDTGITAVAEAKLASELGITLIVTDHHECHEEIPDAYAVVNPRRADCSYPFKELAGVGVVFKVLCALEAVANPTETMMTCVRNVSREYGDLVAIGTVADVMPICDENRLIVSYGLSLIENSARPGLAELMEATRGESKYSTKKKITASYIGYTIAPRINAAGRISNASLAVELFLAETNESAAPIAKNLCEINHQRQVEENKITEEAYAQITTNHDFEKDPVIVLDNGKWHHGIIGIVASRITEKYGCPSILVSFEGSDDEENCNDIGKGSGRSVKGMNLVDALRSCSDLLEKFGGHELAAGLTIKRENLEEFRRRINEHARECLKDVDMQVSLDAECELIPEDITMELANELYFLEPYGVSNPMPVFVIHNVVLTDTVLVGGGKHTRLTLEIKNTPINAMCFRQTLSDIDLYQGDTIDVMFTLDINDFMNQKTLQMIVKDVRLADVQFNREETARSVYNSLKNGIIPENIAVDEVSVRELVPNHDDFAAVYSTLRRELRVEHEVFSIRALLHLLKNASVRIGYVKLKFILNIFRELNILDIRCLNEEAEVYGFRYIYLKTKTNLDKSNIYRKLKSDFCQKM